MSASRGQRVRRLPGRAGRPMSRSRNSYNRRYSRRYRPSVFNTFEKKAERREVHQAVDDELRDAKEKDELLEVLADFHEEHGRFTLAERLRRGRNPAL